MNQRNYSIDIVRVICSILVIGIHTAVFSEYSEALSNIVVQHIGRLAVPFFFVVSGYYFAKNNNNISWSYSRRYLLKLVKVYSIWSAFVVIVALLSSIANHENIIFKFIKLLLSYLFVGTSDTLWFFPALIYSIIIISFSKNKCVFYIIIALCVLLYSFGCFFDTYQYLLSNCSFFEYLSQQIWFNSVRRFFAIGLPFVTLGCYIYRFGLSYKKLIFVIASLLLFFESVFVVITSGSFHIARSFTMPLFIGTFLLFLLSHPLHNRISIKCGNGWRDIATFTYLVHPFIIDILLFANGHFLHNTINSTLSFVIVVTVSILLAILFRKIKLIKALI